MDNISEQIIAVVGIVEYKNKVLIGKKINSKDVLSDKWHIPGGKKEEGETDELALIREIREETNIKIDVKDQIDESIDEENKKTVKWYICKPKTHNLRAGDDLSEVKYVPRREIHKYCDKEAIDLWPNKVKKYFSGK